VFIGGVKAKKRVLTAFFLHYRGCLSALKKHILFGCCSGVVSGVPFFVVFFGPEPGTKKPPFGVVFLPFSWGHGNGFFSYFMRFLGII
jgi:hypothetical protein